MSRMKPIVTRTTAELADALNLDATEARYIEVRTKLMAQIIKEVKRQDLTHVAAAKLTRTSRTRMTAILNGNLKGVSTDLLLRMVSGLGLQTRITFAKAA
jgi:predicted XRE-type DNA-binding protein